MGVSEDNVTYYTGKLKLAREGDKLAEDFLRRRLKSLSAVMPRYLLIEISELLLAVRNRDLLERN